MTLDTRGIAVQRIYVDLDGALLRGDLLFECFAGLIKQRPLDVLRLPLWVLRGKAFLRNKLATRANIDVATLPYRQDVVEYLRTCRKSGSSIILAAATNGQLAKQVASHLQLFDDVLAITPEESSKGTAKSRAIVAHARGEPFCYIGDDADLTVWSHAACAVTVNCSASLRTKVAGATSIDREFCDASQGWLPVVRAIRVHHWLKNLLIFLPLVTSHAWGAPRSLWNAALAFVAFSFAASAVYVLNDLLDLPSDRRHPVKQSRPFASGTLPIAVGLGLAPLLLAAGFAMALAVSSEFVAALAAYAAVTTAYSWILKRYILIDVVALASLYTIRVIAGAIAIDVTPSFWLLAFSGFLFLSLALVKRCSDLVTLAKVNLAAAAGRDYEVTDLQILQAIGVGAGMAAVVVLALYVNSPDVRILYHLPQWLSLLCVTALYAIMRLWIKAARGQIHNDPLLFAASDRGCLAMAALSVAIILMGL